MGLDITDEFRKIVKAKAVLEGFSQEQLNKITAATILPKPRDISPFLKAAFEVDQSIEEGGDFIRSNRQKYTVVGASTDAERDGIENEVALFVKACSTRIGQLQKTAESVQNSKASGVSQQGVAHLHGITLILSEKLKTVTSIFDTYRSVRARQMANVQRRRQAQQAKEKQRRDQKQQLSGEGNPDDMESSSGFPAENGQVQEMAFMEQENKALFDELSGLSQAVHGTEKMMQEIATLNQMFSAQVLSQAEQIEHVYACAVESSMNMEHGNKQLTKAIKMNTSTRKNVVAILLGATFLMLFFDWFNS
ncbi:hypothetical protein BSKO_01840 [Bryopsis sp. KO-2023]|nr:hypothetical protein BSKO_01840 [Bryopsis sp. KO-2023]